MANFPFFEAQNGRDGRLWSTAHPWITRMRVVGTPETQPGPHAQICPNRTGFSPNLGLRNPEMTLACESDSASLRPSPAGRVGPGGGAEGCGNLAT